MAGFYRTFAGPVIVGVSVWCAAGTVAVLSNTSSTERVVALAPWWIGLAAAAIAALVPAWRIRPSTALPALISTLPWWPVPLPAMALVWTGPLAWVPVGAAVLVAFGSNPLKRLGRAVGASGPAGATWLAAVASLVIATGAAWAADPGVPGGDEPHYLVITQSLLKDGDLQIENNHEAGDYSAFFDGTLDPHYLAKGRRDVIYSIHSPGVSAIVLPAFALFGFRGAQATLILLFGVAGALMWRAAWRLTGEMSAAWFAWAAVAGSTTMAVLSFMIFPDAPGACAVAAGVWLLVSHRDASNRAVIVVSAALASLPWLHTRFSVLAGVLGAVLVAMLLVDDTRPIPSRRRRAALFILVPLVSAAAWFSMFYVLYGTFDPRAPYGQNPQTRSWIWGAVTGLFVDQQFGLMAYAPILYVALIGGVMAAPRRWRLLSALCVGVVLLYAMAVASYWMWWAGLPGLPARFLTAALPLLAVPLAVVWARSAAAGRALLLAVLMVSLGITVLVLGVDRSAMAVNFRDGQAAWLKWLNPVVNLPRAWPSFFWNGEGPFLLHAAVSTALLAAARLSTQSLVRRYAGDPVVARVAFAILMPLAFMLIVEAGWLMTATAPLNAARAQLAVHTTSGAGGPVWRVWPGVRRWDAMTAPMRIQPDEAPLTDEATSRVLGLVNVPGGRYRLDVTTGSLPGELSVRLWRSAEPLRRFVVAPFTSQSLTLSLPAGAAVLNVEAENPDLARQVRAVLVTASGARGRRELARQSASYPDGDAFFMDGNVVAQSDGFWVRGGRSAEVVFSQGVAAANRTRVLHVRNAGIANTVTIRLGAWQEVLTLAADQERDVPLPVADAFGTWPVTISSASGQLPSGAAGISADSIGVWIR